MCRNQTSARLHEAAILLFFSLLLNYSVVKRAMRASIQREANDKAVTSCWLGPNVAAVVENRLAGEREPKSDAILLACCDERFE